MTHRMLPHGTICNRPAASNLPNLQVDPRKPIAKLLDALVDKQIFWDATAAVGQLGQTPAIKQVVQPDFVVEPAAHLIVSDKGRGLGAGTPPATQWFVPARQFPRTNPRPVFVCR